MFHSKRKRDVSGITPSSVAKMLLIKSLLRETVTIRSFKCIVANAFQNNNSPLESVSNGLKNVQCIFQRIFDAFLTYARFLQTGSQTD